MAGLVPAIHAMREVVDARRKAGMTNESWQQV
jgi:hypothetical protein